MDTIDSLDFSNKIVLIFKTNSQHEVTLLSPAFETHHGKLFLVGKICKGGSANDWQLGIKTYVAWDQIEEFSVFDSENDYLSRLAQGASDNLLQ